MMIKDALILSNDYFKFQEVINDPENYIELNDGIIHLITKLAKNNQNLVKSAEIIKRIEYRDLYVCVGEILLANKEMEAKAKIMNELDIVSCADNAAELNVDDVEIFRFSIDYGFKDKNPFDSINFYKSENPKGKLFKF